MSGGKGKGGSAGKGKGVRKENRVFDEVLTSQLEQVMLENEKALAKKYNNKGTTQALKSKYWDQVRRRLSVVAVLPIDDPTFPTIPQIRKKWNYSVTRMREKMISTK